METFEIVSLNISKKKSEAKTPVSSLTLIERYGIKGDAHAGDWHRQVSLLAMEEVEKMQKKISTIGPGDFAENITTRGIDLPGLPIGTIITFGDVILEVTQIGKTCHRGCAIMQQLGDCIMPRNGIFAKVIKGGVITNESIGRYSI
jgi:MOSC domain-containing protein YiiM